MGVVSDPRFPELGQVQNSPDPAWLAVIKFDDQGLVQAICQDQKSGEILMVAWMDKVSLKLTLSRGQAVFWSRSRKEYWHKGATSGNVLLVHEFRVDCDGDALLFQVTALGDGAACHTGRRSCFFRKLDTKTQEWVI
jgi:phosphoribosyl-AMP cyclohydrolase